MTARRIPKSFTEAAKMLAAVVWVTGATVVTVGLLGAAPGWLAGEERHVHLAADVDEAARRVGARLYLPAYFPERIAWPPSRIQTSGGRGGSVSIVFKSRVDGYPSLVLLQATQPGDPIAPVLLGRPRIVHESRTVVGRTPATIANVVVDGAIWQQLTWQVSGITLVLRGRADEPELHRLAHGVRREGSGP